MWRPAPTPLASLPTSQRGPQPCKGTKPGPFLGPRATRDTPQATDDHGPKKSWIPPVRPHNIAPQDATRGRQSGWVPPQACTEAQSDRSPRGGTETAFTLQGCRVTRQSDTRRKGTLAAPGAAATRRLPQHGGSSSTRAWTEAMEVPTTPTPHGYSLPPIPNAGPRGPTTSGRTSPPFSRQASEHDRQRSRQTPTRQQTVRPARLPPPSQVLRPASCQGDSTLRTHGQGDPRPTNGPNRGWGDKLLSAPSRKQGARTPVLDMSTGQLTNLARTPQGSPPQLQHRQFAGVQRTHRDNGSTTRAPQERTKK